jgi:hypothetical protein
VVVTRSQTQYSWWLLLFIACSDRRTTPSTPVRCSRHYSQQQAGGSLIRPSIHPCAQVGDTTICSRIRQGSSDYHVLPRTRHGIAKETRQTVLHAAQMSSVCRGVFEGSGWLCCAMDVGGAFIPPSSHGQIHSYACNQFSAERSIIGLCLQELRLTVELEAPLEELMDAGDGLCAGVCDWLFSIARLGQSRR